MPGRSGRIGFHPEGVKESVERCREIKQNKAGEKFIGSGN